MKFLSYQSFDWMVSKAYQRFNDSYYGRDKKNLDRLEKIHHALIKRRGEMEDRREWGLGLLSHTTLPTVKLSLMRILRNKSYFQGDMYRMNIGEETYYSNLYETDDLNGLCEDGTLNAIRYRSIEKGRVFKMKAGRMFNHLMSCNRILSELPEQIQRWLSEEFEADWIDYARENVGETEYTLHVDDNFHDIYDPDSCAGYDEDSDSFGSCMVGDGQWTFYRDAVKAKAAYLTDSCDMIVARCIVFTDVHEEGSDKIWRLAERQYSQSCDPALQRQLVCALIRGGHIDGYKRVGASCGDARGFLDNGGESLEDKRFWIDCALEDGDTISYQDSFKWYDPDRCRADNHGCGSVDLSTTESEVTLNERNWSEYNDEYIDEDDSTWVETRDDYFYRNQVVYASVWDGDYDWHQEYCFEDDCREIGNEWYYAGRDAESPEENGIYYCDECGEYFPCDERYYSDLTGYYYCCESCMDSAETRWHEDNGHAFSDWDDEWYDDSEDVITAWSYTEYGYSAPSYKKTTISVESFNDLVEEGRATEYLGKFYLDDVNMEGEPVHLSVMSAAA